MPTLIEWDANVPDWPTLAAEAELSDTIIKAATRPATVEMATALPSLTVRQRNSAEIPTL
jgi:uncharacterized protein (UPF0276 family)